ncbi:VOC family protein [Candidatus Bipolaricaulota bacterium]|nr:VOC family protein [Candidatus Bipolaricaulota bacterium]
MATGDFCHIQFSSTDIDKTKTFFEGIFGWTFQDIPGFETYAMFQTPGGLGGGVDVGSNSEPPSDKGPILHIEVEEIDATLAKIIEKGGKTIVPKTQISDEFGYFALFLDNVGNRFGLWSS